MSAKRILVTGASGQLGQCLRETVPDSLRDEICWATKAKLDITDSASLKEFFEQNTFEYCINTAAFTAVDRAESESEKAFEINSVAVKSLASICKEHGCSLIHLSTDYVFDGKASEPYSEDDKIGPINVYGASKAAGEVAIKALLPEHFIIRTSWLYSPFGHNFYRSIRKKLLADQSLQITTDQTGTPTNGLDLADFIWMIIQRSSKNYGTFHFSNHDSTTWFGFAKAIAEGLGKNRTNQLAPTTHYATFAARPAYSVLSKAKIKAVFDIDPSHWKDSLDQLIEHDKD